MKKTITLGMLAFFGIVSCCPNNPQNIKGVIADASMSTLSLIDSKGDTITFSTMDAECVSPNGILIGDSVEVFYSGKLQDAENKMTTASKIIVKPQFIGAWVQPIPGMDGVQGFNLNADGTASSINMATLVYKSWTINNGNLILSGESIGNGETISITDTLVSEYNPIDTLNIISNGYKNPFTKQK